MLSFLKQSFSRVRSCWRGELGDKPLIDYVAVEAMLERSRVPAVLMLVLVWTVSAVLLIISGVRQYHLLDWVEGQRAPYSIYSAVDFRYTDSAATAQRRKAAMETIPDYYRLDEAESRRILKDVEDFFRWVGDSAAAKSVAAPAKSVAPAKPATEAAKPAAAPAKPAAETAKPAAEAAKPAAAPAKPAAETAKPATEAAKPAAAPAKPAVPKYDISPELRQALASNSSRFQRDLVDNLQMMLDRGIIRSDAGKNWQVVIQSGDSAAQRPVTVDRCVNRLTKRLPEELSPYREEFGKLLKKLIGSRGNLRFDAELTADERKKAESAVEPVKVSKAKGSLLIRKGDTFTREIREMIDAEREATPGSGRKVVYRQVAWSFFVLLGGVLAIYLFSANIRRDNLRILLAGITISVALGINYNSIKFFEYLLQNSTSLDGRLVIAAVPVAFCAVVLSLVLDLRTAICAGGLVAVVSSLMIMPHRSLELALRWTAISSGAALAVHHVSNYRSFFVRTVLAVLALTFALSLDAVFAGHSRAELAAVAMQAAWTISGNAVACAMLALLMIFVLELLFNLSTDMALMVLSDCNHPLVERLKREAPGTMAHSMAVATLAEDAARAIGANPLRAKAGALFHDIGKLSKPQYFTENNPESSLLHDRLAPQMSAAIIRDHVTEGVALARQYRLCRFIRRVIASHHGDDLVRFFYHKAQEESKKSGAPVPEEQFRYSGFTPRDKEEGIISLADACEAASRSLKNPTPEAIGVLVGNIIQGRFRDGMLRDSRLTAAELFLLQKSFVATLSGMMHGRIAYPGSPAAPGEEKKC